LILHHFFIGNRHRLGAGLPGANRQRQPHRNNADPDLDDTLETQRHDKLLPGEIKPNTVGFGVKDINRANACQWKNARNEQPECWPMTRKILDSVQWQTIIREFG
jgi:hypothetical protein